MTDQSTEKILAELRTVLKRLKETYHLVSLGLFGSYARGEALPESDVDLLAEFSEPPGMEIVDLVEDLERLLNKPVDLVSRKALKPRMLSFIQEDLIYV